MTRKDEKRMKNIINVNFVANRIMWNIWETLIGFAIRDVITNLDIMNDNFF